MILNSEGKDIAVQSFGPKRHDTRKYLALQAKTRKYRRET